MFVYVDERASLQSGKILKESETTLKEEKQILQDKLTYVTLKFPFLIPVQYSLKTRHFPNHSTHSKKNTTAQQVSTQT